MDLEFSGQTICIIGHQLHSFFFLYVGGTGKIASVRTKKSSVEFLALEG